MNIVHSAECRERRMAEILRVETAKLARAAWAEKWPRHCPNCEGHGGFVSYNYPDAPDDYDLCGGTVHMHVLSDAEKLWWRLGRVASEIRRRWYGLIYGYRVYGWYVPKAPGAVRVTDRPCLDQGICPRCAANLTDDDVEQSKCPRCGWDGVDGVEGEDFMPSGYIPDGDPCPCEEAAIDRWQAEAHEDDLLRREIERDESCGDEGG